MGAGLGTGADHGDHSSVEGLPLAGLEAGNVDGISVADAGQHCCAGYANTYFPVIAARVDGRAVGVVQFHGNVGQILAIGFELRPVHRRDGVGRLACRAQFPTAGFASVAAGNEPKTSRNVRSANENLHAA
jgi:hypothetical protein